jgi:hypothetical protein
MMLLSNIIYSQSVPSYVPTNGLVGWWGFNGNAQDGSGNGNHGTVNGATLTTDRLGNQNGAYSFDGTSNYISTADIDLQDTATISVWVYPVGTSGALVDKSMDAISNSGYTFIYNNSNPWGLYAHVGWSGNTNNNILLSNNFISLNQWHHFVLTLNNGIAKIYVDRILVYTQTGVNSTTQNNDILLFGKSVWGGNLFNGKLDDIGIWNRALTQQEITNLYNSQLPTQTSLCLPTITTTSPSSVGMDSVVIGGNIINDGGSSIVLRGVCYSTSPNPNMGNSRTEDGSGIGSFNTVLRGLNPSTTYYARSYAKNSNGVVVYGNEVSFTTSSITIGSNYAGGIVFYVDSTGQHGLVCAPSDQGSFQWGCNQQFIGGTSSLIGFGQSNTNQINLLCTENQIASRICADLILNSYSDWYLPSFNELMEIFWNLQGTNGFSTNFYWSSTEDGQGYAKCMYFSHGFAGSTSNAKFVSQRVRAIRSF